MKLQKLTLTNFQGIRSAEYSFGDSVSIYGDNATGKTTVFNAYTWLLFGRASVDIKDFTPKTRIQGGEMHNAEHSAEAEFSDAGRVFTLKKSFHEVYKKKKGSPTSEFSGHTIDYYVNGVPYKEKDYKSEIERLFGSDVQLKILTMPFYFAESLNWEERRKILFEVCGDIPDEEILSDEHFDELRQVLEEKGISTDEYRKIAASRKKDINTKLEVIPERIDEQMRTVKNSEKIDITSCNAEIAEIDKQIMQFEKEKYNAAKGDNGAVKYFNELESLTKRRNEIQAKYNEMLDKAKSGLRKQVGDMNKHLYELESALDRIQSDSRTLEAKRTQMIVERDKLYKRAAQVKSRAFDENDKICPFCGRELPEDRIAEMIKEFNVRKSRELEEISCLGKKNCSKSAIEAVEASIAENNNKISDVNDKISDINKKIKQAKETDIHIDEPIELSVIKQSIEELEQRKNAYMKESAETSAVYDEKIKGLREQRDAVNAKIATAAIINNSKKRIEELETEENELAKAFEREEKLLYQCDNFTREKVKRITDNINKKFKKVRFGLFSEQINGGLKNDCAVMIPCEDGRLVPFSAANNAARINAGIELIDIFGEHWGIHMPLFIDNAESVTHIANTDTQLIRLVVSEKDKKLRIEEE